MAPTVRCVNFNDLQDAFVCGLDGGLRVYNSDPLVELASLDQEVTGSVKLCVMLHRSSLIALVGGGPRQKFSDHSVMIWDDDKKCFVAEFAFPSEVLGLKMSHAKFVVVLRKQVHVFSFPGTPTKLVSLETRENPHGLCALSADLTMEYLVFPGYRTGSAQLTNLKLLSRSSSASPSVINAHDSELACISLNCQGSLLATASERGTLIRIFSTQKKTKLLEVRRGCDPASIYSIRFNSESSFISVTSDKGTVHVFAVKDPSLNRRSTFHKVGIMGAYVESLWATAKYSFNSDSQCFCGFGRGSTLIVVSIDGSYHKLAYNINVTRDELSTAVADCNFVSCPGSGLPPMRMQTSKSSSSDGDANQMSPLIGEQCCEPVDKPAEEVVKSTLIVSESMWNKFL
uniref:WD repeat domain phosphoinositide-interacting protein 4 n=1 Tax=Trichuris muris TaxID=70415 RepID=A0A5S6QT76_TRIMR